MYQLEPWQWLLATLAAVAIGLSKTGIPGVGILAVGVFALAVGARNSVGLVLPMLITADLVAVASYRRHADWGQLKRLFPWAIVGILAGFAAMGVLRGEKLFEHMIGAVLMALVVVQLWRKKHPKAEDVPHGPLWTPLMGFLAGFLTMIANAAGPVMMLYMLAMKLPKLAFMGTGAWYFFCLNVFKVPFSVNLGIINWQSLQMDLLLAPAVLLGAFLGRMLLPRINQSAFEATALAFTVIAAVKLLSPW